MGGAGEIFEWGERCWFFMRIRLDLEAGGIFEVGSLEFNFF